MSLLSGLFSGILEVLVVFPGMGRVRSERVIGPDEGIEDEMTVDSYTDDNRKLPFKILRKIILLRLKSMKPEGNLADLGCGPGYFTAEIASSFPKLNITALDVSPLMLEQAQTYLAPLKKEIEYTEGNIENLPLPDNSLDFVVSTFSLHHWIDPEQGFKEIIRVVKPGGQFMVVDTRRDAPRLFYRLLKLAQKWMLSPDLVVKNEPTSSIMASYTPEESASFIKDLLLSERKVTGNLFWVTVTGRKST